MSCPLSVSPSLDLVIPFTLYFKLSASLSSLSSVPYYLPFSPNIFLQNLFKFFFYVSFWTFHYHPQTSHLSLLYSFLSPYPPSNIPTFSVVFILNYGGLFFGTIDINIVHLPGDISFVVFCKLHRKQLRI